MKHKPHIGWCAHGIVFFHLGSYRAQRRLAQELCGRRQRLEFRLGSVVRGL